MWSRAVRRMIAPAVVSAVTLLLTPEICIGQQQRTIVVRADNPTTKNLTDVSNDFTGSAGVQIASIQVFRIVPTNPPGQQAVDDTANWSTTTSTPKAGQARFEASRVAGAPPVPPGSDIRFRITFNQDASNIGVVRGADKQYAQAGGGGGFNGGGAFANVVNSLPGAFSGRIDQAVFDGGATGRLIPALGLTIPANQFAYLYQITDTSGPNAITSLQLTGVGSFTNFTVLPGTQIGTPDVLSLVPDENSPGPGVPFNTLALFDSLGPSGVSPLSWALSGDIGLAFFPAILPGQSSDILVAFSAFPPASTNQLNAFASDGANVVDGTLWARAVPEPGTFLLLGSGIIATIALRKTLRR